MAATTISVLSIPSPAVPRGARIAADIFARLLTFFTPAAADEVPERVREAAAVRELAWRMRDSDPSFAADLHAAADRHELAGE